MKNIIILILPIYLLANSLSSEEMTKMVIDIKEERTGISLETLEKTPNPFAIVKPKRVIKIPKKKIIKEVPKVAIPEISYELTAILNHSAFINKKWYKKGDELGTYKVIQIGKKSVTIKSAEGIKKLVIPLKIKKFKIFKGK